MMNSTPEQYRDKGIRLKIVIVWLAILLLGSFWLTVKGTSDPVSMAVVPQVPREGESVIVIFRLNNPSVDLLTARYQFYADGKLLKEGIATIAPGFGKSYKYAYESHLPLGERVTFLVKTQSERGDYEVSLSTPPYPPHIWSSFVSFASFSTSVMSFMATMTYYQGAFGSGVGSNVGLLYTVVLIALLIFLELSQPLLQEKSFIVLKRLRIRFNMVTWLLFIIFMGIFYTRVVMILTG